MIQTPPLNNTTSSRENQITEIIDKRIPLSKNIDRVKNNLNLLSDSIEKIALKRNHLLDNVEDSSLVAKLGAIELSTVLNKIKIELNSLEKLQSRFTRKTLNIGVVGRARQGKSRLLQSLTGLSKAEIPDGDDQHCTGVRSNIYHRPGIETYAEVYFHTEKSFLNEVIVPYYQELNLSPVPISIEDFSNSLLPDLSSNTTINKAKYEHLCKYRLYIDKYREFLLEASPRSIKKSEIREYVAQDTLEGNRVYYAYLAVKKVDIFCSFPNQDIGKISLVDMPGLGDTGIGDEERVIKTLGADIDIVLFVRMPKGMGDFWSKEDVELYDIAKNSLIDLPIEEWSFMVLNHVHNVNLKQCNSLKGDIKNKHILVQDAIIANCTDAEQAQEMILDRVLNHLTQRIDVLDNKYASTCQTRLLEIQKSITTELEKTQNIFGKNNSNDDWFPYFIRLFGKLWRDLTGELEALTKEMINQRDMEDSGLKSAVEVAIQKCRTNTNIPSVKEIIKKRNLHGSFETAYSECLHEVRTHLSKSFLDLDLALKKSLEKAKEQVVKVLITSGKLRSVATGDGREFLTNLGVKIPEKLVGLRLGFEILATFELQYRGLIQHRIRKHLDVLTPDKTHYKFNNLFSNIFGQPTSDDDKAKKIYDNLRKAQQEAVNNCEKELKMLLTEPSQAGFAIVEEFVDRVLRAEGIREEWQIFLQEFATDVWVEEFGTAQANSELKREWLYAVDKVKQANKLELLKLSK